MASNIRTLPSQRQAPAEKPPPCDVEAEEAVLGSILIDPEAIERVAPILQPGDFHRQVNGWIYGACLSLHDRSEGINEITLAHELSRQDRLTEVGGPPTISRLVAQTPTSVHAVDYAEIVARCAANRDLIRVSTDLARQAYANGDPGEIIDGLAARLERLRRPKTGLPEPKSFADVGAVIKRVHFLWPGWLAGGILHMLAAEPGIGKSILALYMAGCFLRGDPWPDRTPFTGELGEVLWCECESGQGLNYDRMQAFKLPCEQILTPLGDPLGDIRLDDPTHRARISNYARRPTMRLIVVDSFSGATRRNENDSIAADNAFWLASLARDTGLPVIAIHHLRKAGLSDKPGIVTLDRLRGHGGITQATRLVWALDIPNPARPEDKRLSVIKSNIGGRPTAMGMGIDNNGCFFGAAPEVPKEETQTDKAADVLLAVLVGGAKTAGQVREELLGAGISPRTMYRAKDLLHIVSVKRGDQWYWSLPADDPEWASE